MWIATAYAQAAETAPAITEAPSGAGALVESMFLVLVLMVLFYVLLIMPQQKRFKEHSKMLADLKKGDDVVTGGGLVGKIHKIQGEDELVVDLGGGVKVTALRSTVHTKNSPMLNAQPANDQKGKKGSDTK